MNEQIIRDTVAQHPLPPDVHLESVRLHTHGEHRRYAVRFLRRYPGTTRATSVAAVLTVDPARDDVEFLRTLLREHLPPRNDP